MLAVAPTSLRATSPRSLTYSAPPQAESAPARADQVELSVPSDQAAPPRSNSLHWLAASAGALALLGAAAPMAAQAAPALVIEQPVRLDLSHALAPGQVKAMRQAAQPGLYENARAERIRADYGQLVETVAREAARFDYQVEELRSLGSKAGDSSMGAFLGGSYVQVRHYGDETVITESAGGFTRSLAESPTQRTIRGGGQSATLYLQDGLFHKAGDFVINLEDQTLSVNQQNPTRIQRIAWNDNNLLETYESPEIVATIYPATVFQYRAQGENSDLQVTIRQDGSNQVKENGQVYHEPGLE
ncbi:MAG: hypothetical protein AB7S38_10220 [Vulcanimicrobiota bacterium]